jgi:hypothetical protein
MSARVALTAAAAAMVIAIPATAQRTDTTSAASRADTSTNTLACPDEGAMLRLWAGARGDSATRATRPAGRTALRSAIDTVITLNITDRTWQRDSLSAGVSLGVAGTAGTGGLPWHACAGATATLGRIAATLHGVHGQIHLKADPGALAEIGRTSGTTPPAPPRR